MAGRVLSRDELKEIMSVSDEELGELIGPELSGSFHDAAAALGWRQGDGIDFDIDGFDFDDKG